MLTIKIREDRARRQLHKIGYRLCKTPARSWRRESGIGYMIVDDRNTVATGDGYSESLENVEAFAFTKRPD